MSTQTSINKVLGAIALSGVSGALTKISADIIRAGDVGLVCAASIFYVYKAQESNATPTTEPFSVSNPPWILKPEDADQYSSSIRWHLTSSAYFNNDLKIAIDKCLYTNTIKGSDEITLYTGSEIKSAKVETDGTFWIKKLTTDSTKLVENLNAEFIKGIHGDLLMTKDGKRAFIAPVSGCEPTEADHLTTKNYVDEKINLLNPSGFMKRDGSTAFIAPVAGLNPTLDEHLATKNYVDTQIAESIEKIETGQNYIIYKTGTREIAVNTSKTTITFGGVLKSYTVFTTIVNTKSDNPFSITATVTKQTNTSFTIDFGGSIDETGYYLNWMIVGMPLEITL